MSSRPAAGTATIDGSSAVRIVTHSAGPFLDTVPFEPVQSIGREGDPDYEFFRIRQVSPLGSGNVVVANGGTDELMFYGSEGSYLRRVGGEGEGPSEFGFLTTVYTRGGDTLAVMDPRRRRLYSVRIYSSTGELVGVFREGGTPPAAHSSGRTS